MTDGISYVGVRSCVAQGFHASPVFRLSEPFGFGPSGRELFRMKVLSWHICEVD